jgi:hypothetical protein
VTAVPLWSMDDWAYLERQVVCDPRGREWTVALMDMLGQAGDPEVPGRVLQMQYASGRYFTLIYSSSGAIQWERGHTALPEATEEYGRLLADVVDGRLDPSRPQFRTDASD